MGSALSAERGGASRSRLAPLDTPHLSASPTSSPARGEGGGRRRLVLRPRDGRCARRPRPRRRSGGGASALWARRRGLTLLPLREKVPSEARGMRGPSSGARRLRSASTCAGVFARTRGGMGSALSADRGAVPRSRLAPLDNPSSVGFADIFSRKGRRGHGAGRLVLRPCVGRRARRARPRRRSGGGASALRARRRAVTLLPLREKVPGEARGMRGRRAERDGSVRLLRVLGFLHGRGAVWGLLYRPSAAARPRSRLAPLDTPHLSASPTSSPARGEGGAAPPISFCARVTADALDALGRADEAAAAPARYGLGGGAVTLLPLREKVPSEARGMRGRRAERDGSVRPARVLGLFARTRRRYGVGSIGRARRSSTEPSRSARQPLICRLRRHLLPQGEKGARGGSAFHLPQAGRGFMRLEPTLAKCDISFSWRPTAGFACECHSDDFGERSDMCSLAALVVRPRTGPAEPSHSARPPLICRLRRRLLPRAGEGSRPRVSCRSKT